jgi:RimJ/RimL family protein N-acetyltransferase
MYPGALVRLRAIEPDDAEARGVPRYADGAYFAVGTHDGVLLGSCGLSGTTYPENRCAQLGIVLGNKAYSNRGYGTDAVRTLCRSGFEEMNLHQIELLDGELT